MKVAVVGCNRGIGLEMVRCLVEQGHEVYGFCRSISDELEELTVSRIIKGFEVTAFQQMQTKLQKAEVPQLDRLIHVSGIAKKDSLDDLDEEFIVDQFRVNSLGPLLTVKAFLPYMGGESKIGLLTSRMGSVEDNSSGGMYGYRMSKAALNAAGKSLAIDLRERKIAVFLLHPGYVQTDMTNYRGDIDPRTSAQGLIKVIEEKGLDDSGTFWHMRGEPLPW